MRQELLQVTLRAPRGGTAVMPSPLEQALHLLATALPPQQYSPATWDFLEHFPALPEEIHSLEQGEDEKCSCELLSGLYCHQKPPAWQWTPGFVFVGRKKICSVSHSVSTSLLASVTLLWCYRWDSVAELALNHRNLEYLWIF